ncbi:MAG: hypothetical protein G3I11_02805 [Ferrovum sp.]|jgi:intracellular septation protein A|nr:hypothetical protein [Ferrovum sp.]
MLHHSDWANLCFLVVGLSLVIYWFSQSKKRRPEKTVWLVLTVMLIYATVGLVSVFVVHRSVAPEPPTLFEYLQPTLLFWGLAFTMLFAPLKGFDYPVKWFVGPSMPLSDKEWDWLSRTLGVILAVVGTVNLVVAYFGLLVDWVGFKQSSYIMFLLLALTRFNFIWSVIFEQGGPILYKKYKAFRQKRKKTKGIP